jgi:hypothetical protein
MRILFMGEPENHINVSSHNARALRQAGAEAVFDPGAFWSTRQWRKTALDFDLIHLISYSQNDPWLLRKIAVARMLGTPILRMWVGSDVLWCLRYAPAARFARAMQSLSVRQFTVADHLGQELEEISIRAETLPIIADITPAAVDPPPLPDRPTALAYLQSDDRREFYGGHIIDELIRRRPDIHFLIVNDPETDYSAFANVESLGQVDDMAQVYARSTVLIRPTAHDGMPRMMLEALSNGRHAICSYPYPHCRRATDLESFERALDELTASPAINEAGRRFVLDRFNRTRSTGDLLDICNRLGRLPRPIRAIHGIAATAVSLARHASTYRGNHYAPLAQDQWHRISSQTGKATLGPC